MSNYDLVVIGAGSGGVRAARMAAKAGVKVAIVEEKYLGGTCVNVGCVPKKLMVYASHFSEGFEDSQGYGWNIEGTPKHSWQTLIDNKNKEISRLNGIYENLLESAGVDIFWGRGRLKASQQVQVGEQVLNADKVLLTVGCTPNHLTFPGSEFCISSDDIFFLPELKQRVAIIGAGYIAVEFAGIFNGLGLDTHIVYRGKRLLKQFDHGIGDSFAEQIAEKGVKVHYHSNITAIEKQADGSLLCQLDNGESLSVDHVLDATGRKALSNDLGLENTQVKTRDNQSIVVDENFKTDDAHVFALGDVIGTPELTPVALAQAMVFVNQQFGDATGTMDYDNIPTAIFSQPSIATVGLSEQEALAKGYSLDIYQSNFRHMQFSLTQNPERTMMKMVVEQGTGKVLGMHMMGPEAAEIIQGFAVAVKAGLTKQHIDATIGIHPSAAEEFVTLRDKSYSVAP